MEFERYVEPFAGSACLFFALKPERALLGDVNGELIGTYLAVRDHPILVARAAAAMPKTRRYYYQLRARSPAQLTDIERAARFIYLNRHCFNGLYRTNSSGFFNVPRGSKTGHVPNETVFRRCSRTLRQVELLPCDFQKTLAKVKAGDFVYLDPPYHVVGRRVFEDYVPGSFRSDDLARLVSDLKRIDAKGACFLLSYADCAYASKLFANWHIKRISVARNIAGFSGNRRRATELLVSNTVLYSG